MMFKSGFKRKKIRLSRILNRNPVRKAIVHKVIIKTPRKPNSARRKTTKSLFRGGKPVFSYIPGGEHSLKKFSNILIRGKGARDLPGVYTIAIRGCLDLPGLADKTKRRSIYGTKKF